MSRRGLNLYLDATYGGGPAMRKLQGDLRGTKKNLDATAVANRKFSQSLGGSTWRRQVQQAGMQISDFSVQVAGGQSAILAFTQNAPQFLQNFGAMGGVIAAVVTILGTMAFAAVRSGAAVRSFSDQIDVTNDALGEYFSLLKQNKGLASDVFTEAEKQIKGSSQAARDLLAIARIRAFDSVKDLAASLANAATEASIWRKAMLEGDRAVTGDLLGIDTALRGHVGNWKDAADQVQEFIDVVRGISTASTLDAMLGNAIEAREIFKSNVDVTGEMTKAQKDFWEQLSQTIMRLQILGATGSDVYNETIDVIGITTKMMEGFNEKIAAGNETAREKLATLRDEIELLTAINKYGEDSAQVTGIRADQEKRAFEQMLGTLTASSTLKEDLRDAFEKAQALGNVDTASGIERAARAAQQMANRLGVSLDRAREIMRLGSVRPKARPGIDFEADFRDRESAGQVRPQMRPMDLMSPTLKEIRAGQSEAEKALKKAKKEAKELMELINDSHPALREMLNKTTNLGLERAKEIQSAFEATQDAISSSMMSAFKGLLDGTKSLGDAVMDILGSIMDRMMDIMFSPLFDRIAGGLAGSLMGSLPSFYGGGQTGSGPRAGGMDGRGGRIAMVHPDETVTDNRRGAVGTRMLGAASTVNVPVQVNIEKGAERDEVRQRQGPNGQQIIDVAVTDSISSGRQDRSIGGRFGSQPQKVRR